MARHDASPDHFPESYRDFQAQDRATPAGMGGARPILPASPVRPPQRRPVDREEMAKTRQIEQRMTRIVPLRASGAMPASGPLILDVDGPQTGFSWDIKNLRVGPADYTAVPYATGVTVLALVRAQAGYSGNQDVSANAVRTWTQAWPAQATFSRHQCFLTNNDELQVIVIGLAAGTVVTVGGEAEETAADVRTIWSE